MKKTKKTLAILLATAISTSLLWGCGSSDEEKKPAVEQKIVYNLGADPKTIDPQLSSAVDGATVISNAFEGLMRENGKGGIEEAIAEKYEVSKDGKVYTFHLRDAKWSDGKAVTAGDFEYAWKRALDPATAAEYAYQLYYLKNGEAFNSGNAKADEVGVKAKDDKTLEVTLEAPVPYFLSLMAFPTYYPVRKDIVEANGDKWTLKPETYVSNGPLKMSEWIAKDSITFVKNDNYWDAKNVKLQTLVYKLIDDETTYLGAFKSDEIDVIESPPQAEIPNLLATGEAKIYPYLGTYFYVVNVSDKQPDPAAAKVLADPKVRKALALAIDRTQIVEKVAQGGQLPATSFVPKGIVDTQGKDFQKDYLSKTADIEAAKKLLSEAGFADGKGIPEIVFTYNTSAGHQMIAQAIQDMWKKNLGINVTLKNEEWAVFQNTRNNLEYSIARHGWIADYNDPMTFLDMWVTDGGQNNSGYSNPEYDKLIKAAKVEADGVKRTDLLHKAEDILMADLPIIPIYYYTNVICAKEKVKDFVKSPLGPMLFRTAHVE